jgi:hypothetical protein
MTFNGLPLYVWAWAVCMTVVGTVATIGIIRGKWGETLGRIVAVVALFGVLIAILYIIYHTPVVTIR